MPTNVVFGITYPSVSVVVPPVYATIAADPSDVLLLDLPIGDRSFLNANLGARR